MSLRSAAPAMWCSTPLCRSPEAVLDTSLHRFTSSFGFFLIGKVDAVQVAPGTASGTNLDTEASHCLPEQIGPCRQPYCLLHHNVDGPRHHAQC